MIVRAIDGRFLGHPFFFSIKKERPWERLSPASKLIQSECFIYLCRAPPLSRCLCRARRSLCRARALCVGAVALLALSTLPDTNCDLHSGPPLPPVRSANTRSACHPSGPRPQLRSACYPAGRHRKPNSDPHTHPVCGPPAPIRVPPIRSAGPQLRSACHPSSPARSLFPGENPKPYCLGNIFIYTYLHRFKLLKALLVLGVHLQGHQRRTDFKCSPVHLVLSLSRSAPPVLGYRSQAPQWKWPLSGLCLRNWQLSLFA